jgi:hypothetical protein
MKARMEEIDVADAPTTCGQGLAQHAPLPALLGEMFAAQAGIFEVHMTALDPEDEGAKPELDAYLNLSIQYQGIASALQKVAGEMAGYRDLPMGRHDPVVMSSAKVLDAFKQYVRAQEAVLERMQKGVAQNQQMLAQMGRAGS